MKRMLVVAATLLALTASVVAQEKKEAKEPEKGQAAKSAVTTGKTVAPPTQAMKEATPAKTQTASTAPAKHHARAKAAHRHSMKHAAKKNTAAPGESPEKK